MERVRLDAYARPWLDMDDRIPLQDKLEINRYELYSMKRDGGLSERERKTLAAGGMTKEEIEEYEKHRWRHLENVAKRKNLKTSAGVRLTVYFIATGVKPAGRSPQE